MLAIARAKQGGPKAQQRPEPRAHHARSCVQYSYGSQRSRRRYHSQNSSIRKRIIARSVAYFDSCRALSVISNNSNDARSNADDNIGHNIHHNMVDKNTDTRNHSKDSRIRNRAPSAQVLALHQVPLHPTPNHAANPIRHRANRPILRRASRHPIPTALLSRLVPQ
jgi:hypothetical protein